MTGKINNFIKFVTFCPGNWLELFIFVFLFVSPGGQFGSRSLTVAASTAFEHGLGATLARRRSDRRKLAARRAAIQAHRIGWGGGAGRAIS